jgi:hypothetical protein
MTETYPAVFPASFNSLACFVVNLPCVARNHSTSGDTQYCVSPLVEWFLATQGRFTTKHANELNEAGKTAGYVSVIH